MGDLLDRHDIDMKEIDVFTCVKQWGETRANESGRTVSQELVNVIERIRFPLMSQDELEQSGKLHMKGNVVGTESKI